LTTVAIGTPAYIEVDIANTVPLSTVTNITWTLTKKPLRSLASLTTSALPSSLPIYEPYDRWSFQVAGRITLRPDITSGTTPYIVTATLATATGSTNVSISINAGTYIGADKCYFCHSQSTAPPTYPSWAKTAHASIFTQGIDGLLGYYAQSCLQCHTVGYDTNLSALNNGGFFGVAQADGWTFPTVLTNGNWASMPADLQHVSNIQCENCHGPGSEHFYVGAGDTNTVGWPLLAVNYRSGDCNQCHDAPTHHIKGTEWYVSAHSGSLSSHVSIPSGAGHEFCVKCHTTLGFITAANNANPANSIMATNTQFDPIGCQTCHEPHGMTSPTNDAHLIRKMTAVTFGDGTVITNGGEGNLCMACHHSRNGSAVTNVANFKAGLSTWEGGTSTFGVHDSPQGDMLEGINAITYGKTFPSSAHKLTVTNSCVGCHMQTVNLGDPAFLKAGGHTFEMSYAVVSGGVTNTVDKVDVCNQCHGGIKAFDFPVQDYNGDGVIEGVQTEVQHLLDQLSTLLPPVGVVKSSISGSNTWTVAQLNAAYNWQFVSIDGSLGVHNAPFATGLLKASIADLTGVSVPGGLPDAWVLKYFGSLANPAGAPNANPSGDGIPNWLKYALGLDPTKSGTAVANGVVYDNSGLLGGGGTNTVQIYTAAEIAFQTVVGTSYQIQGVSSLSSGWQNIGAPLQGTGSTLSYLTPSRNNVQQFFRVVHTP